ncbi:MAG: FKBP-type peptidyl-prolyl cis-trans isomerase [Dysgonamonadaceae bacterium]|jgi:FKBP-type peptidyl-prolyl cis-trans isomerase FklB|nr:FKBP-type peptidyl-prolyl cis-trans isomerase [Dysgonamonadaceae bacterium]
MKSLLKSTILLMMVFAMVTMVSCNAQAPKADLKTDIDSLSYAKGIDLVYAQGLGQYLSRMGIDSIYVNDFIKAFEEGFYVDKNDKKMFARALGLQIGQQVGSQFILQMNQQVFGDDTTHTLNKNNFASGLISALLNKNLLIDKDSIPMYISETENAIFLKQHVKEKTENLQFLEENKSKEGVITTESGLQYKVIKEGKGAKPAETDIVKVDYVGTTIDGEEFDSSIKAGKPAEFPLNRVVRGWTEGIQLMPVGSKYIFYIPYDLAYGERGKPGSIPPFATLIFEVDLHEIVKK